MSTEYKNSVPDNLIEAYDRMMERVSALIHQAEEQIPPISRALDEAKKKAVELGELSLEEAEKIAEYVKRDAEDAAQYLNYSGKELKDWLLIDTQLIEQKLLDMFSSVADRTSVELNQLAEQARHHNDYFTGDIVGPGSLRCVSCGQEMQFHKTSHIPPCPKCHNTAFQRITTQ